VVKSNIRAHQRIEMMRSTVALLMLSCASVVMPVEPFAHMHHPTPPARKACDKYNWFPIAVPDQFDCTVSHDVMLFGAEYVLQYNATQTQWNIYGRGKDEDAVSPRKLFPMRGALDVYFIWPHCEPRAFSDSFTRQPSYIKDLNEIEMSLRRPLKTLGLKTTTATHRHSCIAHFLKVVGTLDLSGDITLETTETGFKAAVVAAAGQRADVVYNDQGHMVVRTTLQDGSQVVDSVYASERTPRSCFTVHQTVLIGTRAQILRLWWPRRRDSTTGKVAWEVLKQIMLLR
jgi:hypothetical protein